jgi:hypothetical protein
VSAHRCPASRTLSFTLRSASIHSHSFRALLACPALSAKNRCQPAPRDGLDPFLFSSLRSCSIRSLSVHFGPLPCFSVHSPPIPSIAYPFGPIPYASLPLLFSPVGFSSFPSGPVCPALWKNRFPPTPKDEQNLFFSVRFLSFLSLPVRSISLLFSSLLSLPFPSCSLSLLSTAFASGSKGINNKMYSVALSCLREGKKSLWKGFYEVTTELHLREFPGVFGLGLRAYPL